MACRSPTRAHPAEEHHRGTGAFLLGGSPEYGCCSLPLPSLPRLHSRWVELAEVDMLMGRFGPFPGRRYCVKEAATPPVVEH